MAEINIKIEEKFFKKYGKFNKPEKFRIIKIENFISATFRVERKRFLFWDMCLSPYDVFHGFEDGYETRYDELIFDSCELATEFIRMSCQMENKVKPYIKETKIYFDKDFNPIFK